MNYGSMSAEFNPLDWQFLYRFPERMHKKSSWTERVPFAMSLTEMLRPRILVELGPRSCQTCPTPPSTLCEFLHTANAKPAATRALFAALGRRVLLETEKRWLNQKSPVQPALTVLKSKSLLR